MIVFFDVWTFSSLYFSKFLNAIIRKLIILSLQTYALLSLWLCLLDDYTKPRQLLRMRRPREGRARGNIWRRGGRGGGERGRQRRKRKKWRERWKCPVYKCAYVGGLRGLRNDFKILHPPFLAKIIFLFACFQKKPTISTTLEYCMLVPCSLIQDMARFQPRFLLAPCLVSGSRGRVRRMLAKFTT